MRASGLESSDLLALGCGQRSAARRRQAGEVAAERLPHLLICVVVVFRQPRLPPSREEAGDVHVTTSCGSIRVTELLVVPRAARLVIQCAEEDRRQTGLVVQAGQLLPDMARGWHGIGRDPGDSLSSLRIDAP
jgi:hypothetical protein